MERPSNPGTFSTPTAQASSEGGVWERKLREPRKTYLTENRMLPSARIDTTARAPLVLSTTALVLSAAALLVSLSRSPPHSAAQPAAAAAARLRGHTRSLSMGS